MKFLFVALIILVTVELVHSQPAMETLITVPMIKQWDNNISREQTLMRFDSDNLWYKTFPPLKNIPAGYDSVSSIVNQTDYDQVIFQAYKRGDMPFSFLKGVIQKWGVDTLTCTPTTINAYLRGMLGKRANDWYYMLDEDGNGDLQNDTPVKLGMQAGKLYSGREHFIAYERYQDGRVFADTTKIKITVAQKVNGEVRRLKYQYIESRKGEFEFKDSKYGLRLSADFNNLDYSNETRIKIVNLKSGVEHGPFEQGNYVPLVGDTLYIKTVKKDGSLVELARKGNEIAYSIQKGFFAPSFTGVNLNQDSLRLSDFIGSYTLVYFWNSSCGSSTIRLQKQVKPIIDKVNSSHLRLKTLGVALDFPEAVGAFIKENNLDWPQIVTSANGYIKDLYKINHYPMIFLIAPDGRVLENALEEHVSQNRLEKVILSHLSN